jgi:23S rRNA pseudouridine1911/1915/1917 synthase
MPLLSAPTGDIKSWHRREQRRLASSTGFIAAPDAAEFDPAQVRPGLKRARALPYPVAMGGHQTIDVRLDAAQAGWRIDRALAASIPTVSRERLKALIRSGAVETGGELLRDPATKVRGGEVVRVTVPKPRPAHNEPQDIPLTIVFEDEHLLVVDKPAGLVVHPAAGNLDGTLVNALLHHCGGSLSGIGGVARPGIVHRIDKDTSGLLVVAKTDVAHEGLAKQFAAHSIDRCYLALVSGVPRTGAGTVDAALARSPVNRKKIAIVEPKDLARRGKRAVTHWKRLEILDAAALVECRLETGRTHQIRVHMASIGHPLLGDPVYGRSGKTHGKILNDLGFRRQALHAAELGFMHPVTKSRLSFSSPMPPDIQELMRALGV